MRKVGISIYQVKESLNLNTMETPNLRQKMNPMLSRVSTVDSERFGRMQSNVRLASQ